MAACAVGRLRTQLFERRIGREAGGCFGASAICALLKRDSSGRKQCVRLSREYL